MNPTNQKGAALIVGLIVLLILTILGLASIGSMTTQLKIASNLQDHNAAFQAAGAGIAEARNDPGVSYLVVNPGITQTVNYVAMDNSAAAVANVTYSDCKTVTLGSSLQMGKSWKGLVHEIRSTGSAYNGNGEVVSENIQIEGIETVRPGC